MTALHRRISWLPPFLLGASGATSAELAAGLLLYTGGGFLRSLTVLLAVELLALGLGLASSLHLGPGDLQAVRRRWLGALLAFAAAAGYAAAWSVGGGFSAAPLAQAGGLALVAGLPLFAVGAALGGVGAAAGDPGRAPGAAGAVGAAAGVTATGLIGVPRLEPPSIFLFCVVAVSAAALIHGWLVDRMVVVRVLAEDAGDGDVPRIRLEERIRGDTRGRGRLVTVDGRPAGGEVEGDGPLLPWERAATLVLDRMWAESGAGRILLVGAAGVGLSRSLERIASGGDDGGGLVALEPWARLGRMVKGDGGEARGRAHGADEEEAYAAVVVSLRMLPGGGPLAGRGLALLERAGRARSPGGLLLLGGVAGEDGVPGVVDWIARRPWCPQRLILLRARRKDRSGAAGLLRADEGSGGGLLLGRPRGVGGSRPIPEALDPGTGGFELEVVVDRTAGEGGSGAGSGAGP